MSVSQTKQTLSKLLSFLFPCCAFLSHFLTEIHCYSGATYFLRRPKHLRILLLLHTWHIYQRSLILLRHGGPGPGQALVRRRRQWVGCEVDAGGDGRSLATLNLPAHLLGEEGEVLPQFSHTNLQLVALAQQLLLLTHLNS